MAMVKNRISFVIPCYRSEATIQKVTDEIVQVVGQRPEYDYEIICVNDGSPDNVYAVLVELARKDKKIKVINGPVSRSWKNTRLKSKKKYYYKVRAYSVVNGKNVYGSYSAVKGIRTK
jgi:cellulose synthase/poly-beta-1,6-N-acetylglucosamine synthase-like glycosyltransferase